MITSELTDFLVPGEKESILRAISASDKILSSGICRLLTVENDIWFDSQPPAVALFLKNSSERYYRISVIEPSTEKEWEPIVQFEHTFSNKDFETYHLHANLLSFVDSKDQEIGLNFYDSKECLKFHDTVCKRKIAGKSTSNPQNPAKLEAKKEKTKKKKSFLHGLFGNSKEKKPMEISSPTDFRHVDGVKLNEDQEDLYQQVMSKLKTTNPEEEEIVKRIVLTNENEFRKSIMVKKKSQTPKEVKEKKEKKSGFFHRHSKAKIEDIPEAPPTQSTPIDPLNPDWNSAPTVPISTSYRTSVVSTVLPTPTVTPKTTEWAAPRKDTYGVINKHEPRNLYRFEEEKVEIKVEIRQDERPPELPSRSSSRHVEQATIPAPRLPNHRGSYRWATQPEIVSKNAKNTQNSQNSANSHHKVEEFAEIELSPPPKTPVRVAPPPPVSVPSVNPSGASKSSPPPPPPLPPVATVTHSIPQAPPPPPAPPLPISGIPEVSGASGPPPAPPPPPPVENPTIRLKAVPEINSDRRSLLDEIQSADRSKILRKVSETSENRQSVVSPTSGGTMIDQIQNFLDARRAGINPSDSEESDDEEEWSD